MVSKDRREYLMAVEQLTTGPDSGLRVETHTLSCAQCASRSCAEETCYNFQETEKSINSSDSANNDRVWNVSL